MKKKVKNPRRYKRGNPLEYIMIVKIVVRIAEYLYSRRNSNPEFISSYSD